MQTRWNCHRITVGAGPEDFELDPSAPRLIVGSKPPYVVSLQNDEATPIDATLPGGRRLHMIGISAVLSRDGVARLYAVNKGHDAIEVFRIEPHRLAHETELRAPKGELSYANEVLALPDGDVYVSRSQGSRGIGVLFELVTKRPWAKVMHHRNGTWRVAASHLVFANGLQISANQRTLYVAAFDEKTVYAYPRNHDGSLDEANRRAFRIPAHPDNLKWLDDGRLLIAAHPSKLRTFAYMLGFGAPPSQVYALDVTSGQTELLYEGRDIPAASTAFVRDGRMYVSQIKGGWMVSCR